MELFQEPPKKFYVINTHVAFSFTDSTNRSIALHVILNRFDVFGALEELHGNSSDIGAHQNFQMPEFFMPKLILKELCIELQISRPLIDLI